MASIQHLALARSAVRDCTYNLFRNRPRPEILCAVPQDHPVRASLARRNGFLSKRSALPIHRHRASTIEPLMLGMRFDGLYLFQVTVSHERKAA